MGDDYLPPTTQDREVEMTAERVLTGMLKEVKDQQQRCILGYTLYLSQ